MTGEPHIILKAKPPFNLRAVSQSHGWVQLAPFRFDAPSGGFYYIDRLANGRVIEWRVEAGVEPASVRLILVGMQPTALLPEERHELETHLSWMLSLEQDLSAFYAAARREPKLQRAESQALGRVLRSATLFEDIVKTILTTNTLWAATIRMARALVELYGDPVSNGDATRRAFPAPERLAAETPDHLRQNARLGYRAPYIHDLAVRVASGDLNLEELKDPSLPTLELRKRLQAIKGVGPYAAATLLMLLGRGDFIPVDSYALKMVSREWHQGEPVTEKEVQAVFDRWGEWKGLAYWFWEWSNQE